MVLNVTKAEYAGDYRLLLHFDNGEKKVVDLKDTIFNDRRAIFQPLRQKNFFRNFRLEFNTISWKNGADFAPEFLYALGDVKTASNEVWESTIYRGNEIIEEKSASKSRSFSSWELGIALVVTTVIATLIKSGNDIAVTIVIVTLLMFGAAIVVRIVIKEQRELRKLQSEYDESEGEQEAHESTDTKEH